VLANLRQVFRYRALISSLGRRAELKARYRGSVLGFLWTFANPLLLLGIYTVRLHRRDAGVSRRHATRAYALFLLCGILPWTWFQTLGSIEKLQRARGRRNLIRKVLFPGRRSCPIVTVPDRVS
jgi:ABC-type polysaccharide/polyol phosphate export permease